MIVLEWLFLTIAPCDAAEPWQLGFQDAVTPIMQGMPGDITFISFSLVLRFFLPFFLTFCKWNLYYLPQTGFSKRTTTIEILGTLFFPIFLVILNSHEVTHCAGSGEASSANHNVHPSGSGSSGTKWPFPFYSSPERGGDLADAVQPFLRAKVTGPQNPVEGPPAEALQPFMETGPSHQPHEPPQVSQDEVWDAVEKEESKKYQELRNSKEWQETETHILKKEAEKKAISLRAKKKAQRKGLNPERCEAIEDAALYVAEGVEELPEEKQLGFLSKLMRQLNKPNSKTWKEIKNEVKKWHSGEDF